MKKLSLDQLKEKVTVISDVEAKHSISGGDDHNILWWAGHYTRELWDWVTEI